MYVLVCVTVCISLSHFVCASGKVSVCSYHFIVCLCQCVSGSVCICLPVSACACHFVWMCLPAIVSDYISVYQCQCV